MDSGKIMVCNFSHGGIGEDHANFLAAILTSMFIYESMNRPRNKRQRFYVICDEFQHFAGKTFAKALSETRAKGLSIVAAHQFLSQKSQALVDSLEGNVFTQLILRCSPSDAIALTRVREDVTAKELASLPPYTAYLRAPFNQDSSISTIKVALLPEISFFQVGGGHLIRRNSANRDTRRVRTVKPYVDKLLNYQSVPDMTPITMEV